MNDLLFTPAEIDAIREEVTGYFPDVGTIYRRELGTGTGGNSAWGGDTGTVEALAALEDVPVLLVSTSAAESARMAVGGATIDQIIRVPAETDIRQTDVIDVLGQRYEVVSVNGDGAYHVNKIVGTRRVD